MPSVQPTSHRPLVVHPTQRESYSRRCATLPIVARRLIARYGFGRISLGGIEWFTARSLGLAFKQDGIQTASIVRSKQEKVVVPLLLSLVGRECSTVKGMLCCLYRAMLAGPDQANHPIQAPPKPARSSSSRNYIQRKRECVCDLTCSPSPCDDVNLGRCRSQAAQLRYPKVRSCTAHQERQESYSFRRSTISHTIITHHPFPLAVCLQSTTFFPMIHCRSPMMAA